MERHRNINYDFIRAFAMICMICVHTGPKPFQNVPFGTSFFNIFVASCNGLFYVLSGRLNLHAEYADTKSMLRYYFRRIGTLIVPYIVMTIILKTWMLIAETGSTTPYLALANSYGALMSANISSYLWFMYPLMGMILSAPFLSRLYHSLGEPELKLLYALGIAWLFIQVYLCDNLGVSFAYSNFIVGDWCFYFFLGYYTERMMDDKKRKRFYIAGVVGFILSAVLGEAIPEHFTHKADMNLTYTFFVVALFLFLEKHAQIKAEIPAKIVRFLAKHSFLVYLIHWNVSGYWTRDIVWNVSGYLSNTAIGAIAPAFRSFPARVLVTLSISLLIAAPLNYLIFFPLQRQIDRVGTKYVEKVR